jgi:hypothetical protein
VASVIVHLVQKYLRLAHLMPTSMPSKVANKPKCWAVPSADFKTTGMFRLRPITLTIAFERHVVFGDGMERR